MEVGMAEEIGLREDGEWKKKDMGEGEPCLYCEVNLIVIPSFNLDDVFDW